MSPHTFFKQSPSNFHSLLLITLDNLNTKIKKSYFVLKKIVKLHFFYF